VSTYRVVNKAHTRATFAERILLDARGNPYTLLDAGPTTRYEVGTLLSDLTPEELAAFPDRFQMVDGEAESAAATRHTATLNPQVMALVQRAHAGDATKDEQAVVGEVLAFVTSHLAGTATAEATEHMALVLADFGIDLFV